MSHKLQAATPMLFVGDYETNNLYSTVVELQELENKEQVPQNWTTAWTKANLQTNCENNQKKIDSENNGRWQLCAESVVLCWWWNVIIFRYAYSKPVILRGLTDNAVSLSAVVHCTLASLWVTLSLWWGQTLLFLCVTSGKSTLTRM